jgi:hypothetical protein
MAKCTHCRGCLKIVMIYSRLYSVCKLCKSIYFLDINEKKLIEVLDEDEKEILISQVPEMNRID